MATVRSGPRIGTAKISIVGAGSVGAAVAYACLLRGTANTIALFDTNAQRVRAEVLDLNHGTQFTPACRIEGSDEIAVTAKSDLVVITAGAKQQPGQSRLDLAAANVAITQSVTPRLLAESPDAVLLFVSNPVDIVTAAAIAISGVDDGRVFGSGTVLDSGRLRYLIAERAGVAIENTHAFIVGEHGDSELALWSGATVGGIPIDSYTVDGRVVFDDRTRADIFDEVVRSAYEIIQGKGATNLAIGLSTARIVEAVLRDQRRVLPVSSWQTGVHGVRDVCLSLPTIVDAGGADRVLEVPLSADEAAGLAESAATLHNVQKSLGL